SLPAGGVRRVDTPEICRAECSGRVEKPAVLHDSLGKRAAVHKKRSPFHAAGGVAGKRKRTRGLGCRICEPRGYSLRPYPGLRIPEALALSRPVRRRRCTNVHL